MNITYPIFNSQCVDEDYNLLCLNCAIGFLKFFRTYHPYELAKTVSYHHIYKCEFCHFKYNVSEEIHYYDFLKNGR